MSLFTTIQINFVAKVIVSLIPYAAFRTAYNAAKRSIKIQIVAAKRDVRVIEQIT